MSIQIARTKSELQSLIQSWKNKSLKIGFVPTMGALHDGHLSLVKLALEKTNRCVVSIFVNPTQFAPHEDFEIYPREEDRDCAKLEGAGAHLVYLPAHEEIYPNGIQSNIRAGKAAHANLEDRFRPTHFDGVVNVVARLFDHVKPDVAVFGQKDYQQLQVLREMTVELNLSIEIIGAPIIRDEHGLALSSRNAYLSSEELEIARMLNQIIYKAAYDINEGAAPKEVTKKAKDALLTCGFDKVDYVAYKQNWNRVLIAAWLGKTRLIDNVGV